MSLQLQCNVFCFLNNGSLCKTWAYDCTALICNIVYVVYIQLNVCGLFLELRGGRDCVLVQMSLELLSGFL
jgi:hypothetical protein